MTLELNESFAYFNLYISTLLWFLIASAALVDSFSMHKQTKEVYKIAREYGNGRTVMAKGRYDVSWWFLVGFMMSWLIGLLAILALFAVPVPRPDTTIYTFVLRYILIGAVFAFWRAKRTNILISRQLDALAAKGAESRDGG